MNNWLLTDAEIEAAWTEWARTKELAQFSSQDFLKGRFIARAQLRKVMRGIELEGHCHLCEVCRQHLFNLPLWKELRLEAGLGGGRSG